MPFYRKLHWQILIGLGLGLIYGLVAAHFRWGDFVKDWVAPFGEIFVNLLKLVAIPLVLTSLIAGVASLSDLKRLGRMGGRTFVIYVATTAIAVTIGLITVNVLQPGKKIPESMRADLQRVYGGSAEARMDTVKLVQDRGPLQPLVDMVPDNFFGAASTNGGMLQMVFVSILLGIALIQVPKDKSAPVIAVVNGLMETVIRVVHLIMLGAPVGVFALIANTITELAGDNPGQAWELVRGLGLYCLAVIIGLVLQVGLVYCLMLRFMTRVPLRRFFKALAPAQLLAFSTSSSGATLPVTMERCEKHLGIHDEVTSFVVPLGATINMDGTALYQAVAAVFIGQTLGIAVGLGAQMQIVLMAVLASIGTAAVPGAGVVMLVVILEQIGVPSAGIALILGVDRILDMLRTVTNVTGDATVATIIATGEGQIELPVEGSVPD